MQNLIQLVMQKWGFTASRHVRNREALLLSTSAMMAMLLVGCSGGGGGGGSSSSGSSSGGSDNSEPTGSVIITGTPEQGQTLFATNEFADEDGIGAVTYTWSNGATGASMALVQSDVDNAITVTASYTDGQGTIESVTSATTVAVANVNFPPTGSVTISGTPEEGQVLTASHALDDQDGMGFVSYIWYESSDGQPDRTITIGEAFTLEQSHVGKQIVVMAEYRDGDNKLESKVSSATVAVANVNDTPTGSVTITGAALVGQTLFASNDFADKDGMGDVSYKWYKSSNDQHVLIGDGEEFTLERSHLGTEIVVKGEYTDEWGVLESKVSAVFEVPGYFQDFNGCKVDNAVDLDGIYWWNNSGFNMECVRNLVGEDVRLQLLTDYESVVINSFSFPTIDGSSNGFRITFDYMMSDGLNEGPRDLPADGFSVNYGDFELDQLVLGEMGPQVATNNISFVVDTFTDENDRGPKDAGVRISEVSGGSDRTIVDSHYGSILSNGQTVSGTVEIIWDPDHGASFNTTGLNTNADFDNIEIPNFTGSDEYYIMISARAGGSSQDLFIDNLSIELGSFGDIG